MARQFEANYKIGKYNIRNIKFLIEILFKTIIRKHIDKYLYKLYNFGRK